MYAFSDIGRVRRNNEDRVYVNAQCGFALLADGMGGHNAGEIASEIAIATIAATLAGQSGAAGVQTPAIFAPAHMKEVLCAAIASANAAIFTTSRQQPGCAGMGTTLVALQFVAGWFVLAHIGDSRCYRLRMQELTLLTRDHSVVQQRIEKGLISRDEARGAPGRHMLTRALGTAANVTPEFAAGEARPGDIFLLCSDGLSDMLDDAEIASIIAETSASLTVRAQRLIQLTNQHGGRDNVSVILVAIKDVIPEPRETNRRQGG